ncbi:MAG: putative zinc-binding protein [bacterium]
MSTHENVIFTCLGRFSNTGITAALASIEAVKELGLDKVCIGCLAGLPVNVPDVYRKTKAARKIVTVDGCSVECSRKVTKNAGFKSARSFMLVRDIGMKKKPLHEDIGGNLKPVMDYISEEDIKRAKELIVKAINDEVN